MGADLYIESIFEGYGKAQGKGYFQDSYYRRNLLWLFDLSYWVDVYKLLDDKGYMQVPQVKEFLAELTAREAIFEEQLPTRFNLFSNETPQETEAYFRWKYAYLKSFLNDAITLEQPIRCSV